MAKTIHEAAVEIEDVLSRSIQVVGEPEEKVYTIPVSTTELVDFMARTMFEAVQQLSPRDLPVTCEEVEEAMRWLLKARLAYVSGIRGTTHPRDIEYPAMMGPVLAAVGKYRDEVANVTIVPTVDDEQLVEFDSDGLVSGIIHKRKLERPESYTRVVSALRVMGVPTVFGLPMEKEVDSDEIFRLDVVGSVLRGSRRDAPAPTTLFARAMVEMVYLANLYGEARIQYTLLSSVKASIYDLVLRNIDGPRVSHS
jgi:hypothetical protein